MKGIILAGGSGSRLSPITSAVNKHLLPVYDKPVIYYSISILLQIGIKDILIISTPEAKPILEKLLGNGAQLGLTLSYAVQDSPRGIADAFIVGEEFIGKDPVCLVLGDNFLYGSGLQKVAKCAEKQDGATVFAYPVANPSAFGVIELDAVGNVLSIEEKPMAPKSNYAIPGIYLYDHKVVEYAKTLIPTARGEIEIGQINQRYLDDGTLRAEVFDENTVWFDTGSPQGLLRTAVFIEAVQRQQGKYVGCIEELAWRCGYIDDANLLAIGEQYKAAEYGQYLLSLLK